MRSRILDSENRNIGTGEEIDLFLPLTEEGFQIYLQKLYGLVNIKHSVEMIYFMLEDLGQQAFGFKFNGRAFRGQSAYFNRAPAFDQPVFARH